MGFNVYVGTFTLIGGGVCTNSGAHGASYYLGIPHLRRTGEQIIHPMVWNNLSLWRNRLSPTDGKQENSK